MSSRFLPRRDQGLVRGFRAALEGLGYTLTRPRLLGLAVLPLLIQLGLTIGALWLLPDLVAAAFKALYTVAKPEEGLAALGWWLGYWLLHALLWLLGLVAAFLAVVAAGNIIAAPIYEALSERAEELHTGRAVATPSSWRAVLRSFTRALWDQLSLLLVWGSGAVAILMLNVIPLLGSLLAALLGFGWSVWFLALQFTEAPLARRELGWFQRWSYMAARGRQALGFGAGCWILLLVPLTAPFLVVAGTLLVCQDDPPPTPPEVTP